MSRPVRFALIALIAVAVSGVFLSQVSGAGSGGERLAGPDAEGTGPEGILGFVLLLESSGHSVDRIGKPPSGGDLDSAKTTVLIEPGSLTAADAEALERLASEGGRVVIAGDPGSEALELLIGAGADVASSPVGATFRPVIPAPENAGIRSVEAAGGSLAATGGALPLLADAGGEALAAARTVGEGRITLVATPSPVLNASIASADNAQLALNLAGPEGREVQLVEAVSASPGSGLSALPSEWGWAAGGVLLAVGALALARGRRLGPPELAARELEPPRREYVDALAGALLRTRDPASAGAPLVAAARDRVARRARLSHEPDADELRRAALAAGLEPAEADAIAAPAADERAMLTAAGALAKLNNGSRKEVGS